MFVEKTMSCPYNEVMAKYHEIYEDLKGKIEEKEYAAGTYLPSENELMKIYESSRDTIRKSLELLASSGYIQKEKRKGSLVLDVGLISFPVSGLTSFKELEQSSHRYHSKTEVASFLYQHPDSRIQKKLNMDPEGYAFSIKRVREIDGERIILDEDHINAAVIPGLTEEIAADSIYEYIENELKLPIAFARKEITVVRASEEDQRLLDMKGYDLLVCVKSYNFLEDATLFCYTVSKHRPDKFRFVEFSRREKER